MANREFEFSQWAVVSPATDWSFASGFFVNNSRYDLFGYHPSNGTLWVGVNTGNGFTFQQWGVVSPAAGWQFAVGDFTGDGRSDVLGYHPSNGTLWLGENLGDRFQLKQWGLLDPASGWQIAAGFFTGTAKMDLFAYHPSNGSLWVGQNTGNGFSFQQWGTVDPVQGWQLITGDFTGNGRTDIVGYHPSNGTVWVGENLGTHFTLSQWGKLDPVADWQIAGGYFTGRGKLDLFAYHPSNGSLWVGENTGNGAFSFQRWATVDPVSGWQFVTGVFDADLWFDVVGYHPSNGTLWLGVSTLRPIEGYCWPLSAAPGDDISFMISGDGPMEMVFSRHTSLSANVDSIPMQNLSVNGVHQPTPANAWRVGCGWSASFKQTIPASWPSGIYSATCVDAGGSRASIAFVVKPVPADRAQLAVIANVNTWLAYNGWGGESKYSGAAHVSFLRPNPAAAVDASEHLTRGELWVLGWLEKEGLRPDVYTDIDFHNGFDNAQYRCLILSTHPEYWSMQAYDNLKAYLAAGGSVLYLGGNAIYENGEYENNQTSMSFRMGVEGGPRVTALFRMLSPARAERTLLGVATERCGVMGSPLQVLNADHPLFAGTKLKNEDPFGQAGLNTGFGNGKSSAWEVDTSNGPGATSTPTDCATESGVVPPSPLPPGLVVLARAPHDGVGPGAEMVYYDHPGGGFVLSIGSITVGGSLVVDASLQQIVRNALKKAGLR
jgi:hypothetical protein